MVHKVARLEGFLFLRIITIMIILIINQDKALFLNSVFKSTLININTGVTF